MNLVTISDVRRTVGSEPKSNQLASIANMDIDKWGELGRSDGSRYRQEGSCLARTTQALGYPPLTSSRMWLWGAAENDGGVHWLFGNQDGLAGLQVFPKLHLRKQSDWNRGVICGVHLVPFVVDQSLSHQDDGQMHITDSPHLPLMEGRNGPTR